MKLKLSVDITCDTPGKHGKYRNLQCVYVTVDSLFAQVFCHSTGLYIKHKISV